MPSDPILAGVVARLPLGTTRPKETAILAFYRELGATVFTGAGGLSDKGRQAMVEIARADHWGLDASAFKLPPHPQAGAPTDSLAQVEIAIARAVLAYARHARGGRLDPQAVSQLFDRKPPMLPPRQVLEGVAKAVAADAYLAGLHPRHAQFQALRRELNQLRTAAVDKVEVARIPDGPVIRPGGRHPHVALVRGRLGLKVEAGADPGAGAERFDEALVAKVKAYQSRSGLKPDGIIGRGTRAAFNATATVPTPDRRALLIANMERWRWMPSELGVFHVWDNVPEQMSRVVDGDRIVFEERVIVGKASTPTTSFSANMKMVTFQPSWYLPESIKVKEIGPKLTRAGRYGDYWGLGAGGGRSASSVLARQGLEASMGGRVLNPDRVDWSRLDMRKVTLRQPPGPRNALGVVKFLFPNKHDIYMHDTPQRHLFKRGVRTFSHGCIRVENPLRLAEVLLARDKGWDTDKVRGLARRQDTNEIRLGTEIPVHVAYFTAVAAADGTVRYLSDIYNMDKRVTLALAGRPLPPEAKPEPAVQAVARRSLPPGNPYASQRQRRQVSQTPAYRPSTNWHNPFASVFGNY